MAFSIIISEKGGAERREAFDKNEINVGRVQGNDLMLPKGNVSKHHARLLYRDGRFIVTDLKSTNGTYVNGRKIAQATIVREGDKIYIGDFVLRLESAGMAAPPPEPQPTGDEESIRTLARGNAGAPIGMPPLPGGPMGGPPMGGPPMGGPPGPMPPPLAPPPPAAPMPPPQPAVTLKAPTHPPGALGSRPAGGPPQPVTTAAGPPPDRFPLERDPDESEPLAGQPKRPSVGPPPIPQGGPQAQANMRASTMPLQQVPPQMLQRAAAPGAPGPLPPQAAPPPQRERATAPPPQQAPQPSPGLGMQGQATRIAPRETAAQAGKRLALITLVDRIAEAVDLSPLRASPVVDENFSQALDRAAREQSAVMRDEGEAPEGIDLEALVRDALRELVGLGPLGPLLEDDDVAEIHCVRHDQVLALRGGAMSPAENAFTSEEALQRVIARLAQQSGESWKAGEATVERRLPRGAHMIAVGPPAAGGHVLVIRKRRRVDTSLEELVRSSALSRQMAVFLEACLVARANIVVCGGPSAGTSGVLAALAGTGPSGERVCVLHEAEELHVGHAHIVAFPVPESRVRAEDAVRAASRIRPDRMVVMHLSAAVAGATIDAIADGAEGVLAGVVAPTLRQGLARVGAQLALARPGLGADAVRDAIGESFDVGVEVGALPDGRLRILRIAELAGGDAKAGAVRDIFTYVGEAGSADQSFTATGVVPRIVGDLGARGVKIDQNLFKRAAGRA